MKQIYLDHIAATPLLPEAREAMLPYLTDCFGNPQSRHRYGAAARAAVESARARVAALICCTPSEVIFTASGSEANNLAIKGILAAGQRRGRHIVTTQIEHYSVSHPLKNIEKQDFSITWLPVDKTGRIHPKQVEDAIREETVLVSILHANNEIGTIQPIEEIARITADAGVLLHTDAVASVGWIPFHCGRLGIDSAALSAQQFYGPKGAGALYVRRGVRIAPLIEGGIQEGGRRAGTENVAAIAGMGAAATAAVRSMDAALPRLTALRDRLIAGLCNRVPLLHLTGHRRWRLPHIASFAVEYLDGEALTRALEKAGVIAASGSSCSADALKISPVLTAIGLPANVAQGGIIFSLGRETTSGEIDRLLEIFPPLVEEMRRVSPLYAERVQVNGAGNG